jgi:hypothetical protein
MSGRATSSRAANAKQFGKGTTSVVPLIPERRRALAPAVSFTVEKSKPQALKRRQISSILWHD